MNQNLTEGANMGNKEEIKANIFEKFAMAKKASARNMTGAEDLLSAMSVTSNQDATPEIKTPHKTHWQQIFMVCCCILVIAAAAKAFLYLDTKISAVAKELNMVETQAAMTNTKEQLAVTAEIKDLKAANTQLRAEVKELREAFEMLKAKKNNVVSAQRKR
jgi:FtsZ-binding cell division protein ZapB